MILYMSTFRHFLFIAKSRQQKALFGLAVLDPTQKHTGLIEHGIAADKFGRRSTRAGGKRIGNNVH